MAFLEVVRKLLSGDSWLVSRDFLVKQDTSLRHKSLSLTGHSAYSVAIKLNSSFQASVHHELLLFCGMALKFDLHKNQINNRTKKFVGSPPRRWLAMTALAFVGSPNIWKGGGAHEISRKM